MKNFKNLFAIYCATALVACGGGSAAPDTAQPATAANPPAVNKLTIRGAVTDDPIDAAQVSFRVGERHYEALLDSDVSGGFSVDIEYVSLDDLVYGQALREATGIHFVGDVTTVRDLLALADDGVVRGAKISNLTTAKFVLACQATDDGRLDSFDEFMRASRGVDPDALVTVGAAIKAVVEAIDGTVMPSGANTTLELAEQIASGASSFVSDLNTASPGTLAASISKMLSDGFATDDFDAERVPGVYMSTTSLAAYALFADGSGLVNYFDDRDIERVQDWRVNGDGDLTLSYASADAREDMLQILSASGDALQLNQVRSVPSGAGAPFEVANFEFYEFEGRFEAGAVAGTYSNLDGSGRDFVLSVGGSGFYLDANGTVAGSFSWSVAGDGRLVLTLSTGSQTVLTRLGGEADAVTVLALETRVGGAVESMVLQRFSKD